MADETRPADAIDAASLILMRERPDGPPLILMVQRASSLVFAGGAYVFPGGRLDPEDRSAAELYPALDPTEAASRIAAVRETEEETGIVIGTAIEALVPFARWRPDFEQVPRRFDTRFYLASIEAPQEPKADGMETARAFWASAADMLERCAAGDGHAIFPTRRLLERLAGFGSFADAREQAERLPQQVISPWIETDAEGDRLCIPTDAGYPVTSEPIAHALRY
jgi:8-oxo-dGTP pyrophosphatase MutT (NUDIX family)